MLVPSLFNDNFVSDFFNDTFDRVQRPLRSTGISLMNTDVKEFDDRFELAIELPGFEKENVSATLKDGYLKIEAKREEKKDESENGGKYIRKERYVGSVERSFYVGEDVKQEDIKAKFDNGMLDICIPKIAPQPEIEESKFIAIE